MFQAQLISPPPPTVSLINDRPATTSRDVASFFGKRHDDVLKSVRVLFDSTPQDFRLRNFSESSYVNEQGKEQPMFILHRDGFMLLVMGYTGKKAMQIKIAYIEAFNAMEAALAGNSLTPSHQSLPITPSTAADRKPLRSLVSAWAKVSGLRHDALWPQVRSAFNLYRIDELPLEWIPDALAWVQAKIDEAAKVNPLPPAAAEPDAQPLFRNGCFHTPQQTRKHVSGPQEAGLAALSADWTSRACSIESAFMELVRDIRTQQGDVFFQAVSDMGHNAENYFSVDCLLQGMFCAQDMALDGFKNAMSLLRLHLRMAHSLAVAQGR